MLCSRCGALIESKNSKFCPKCGYELNSYSIPIHRRSVPGAGTVTASPAYTAPPAKKSHGRTAIIAGVIALVVVVAAVSFADLGDGTEKTEVQRIDGDSYLILTGAFLSERDTLAVSMTGGGLATFSFKQVDETEYTSFSWNVHQIFGAGIIPTDPMIKTEFSPSYTLKPGKYSVIAECYNSVSDQPFYLGTFTYVGTVTEEYNWTHHSTDYSIELTFNYEKYLEYKNMNTKGRAPYSYSKIVSFVTYNDPVIKDLVDSLRAAYGPGADLDQHYASFILAFVQIVFDYYYDEDLYGLDEYYAYPLEVIAHRGGDCEDTSIFAAALFKAAGFDAGVILLPGHAVAAVGLDVYDPGVYSAHLFEVLSQKVDGITYYGCETTADFYLKVGLVDGEGYENKLYSWYLENESQYGYKVYVVT
ncbi:MAG: zinc-ribbon domain-containing protein [Methanomassiliicoccaceae archaeon]|nr:zinc-ribbon domain-containing protein [Methanomassiliicoccaceae archaeon]